MCLISYNYRFILDIDCRDRNADCLRLDINGWGAGVTNMVQGVGRMIRSELVQKLAQENPDLSLQTIDKLVDLVFKSIVDRLATGGRVELRGFGAFTTRGRDARVGRNPRTGEEVSVPAKRVPHFKPGKEMRERLNANGED